ncbi:MAG: transcriptional regulator [Nitriliruptorales bacterium]
MPKSDYQQLLGRRLRAIRQQQDLTLQQVEEKSGGTWKAVVIGAYERGDRAISAAKLAALADFYSVPVGELLPEPPNAVMPAAPDVGEEHTVVLDLTRLAEEESPALRPISRYATTIQQQRGDYNGRMLTLRSEDVRTLSVVLGVSTDEFIDRLTREGVVVAGNGSR